MIVVHHLNNSRSQRILWLLEELGLDYEVKRYERDSNTMLAPAALKEVHPLGKSPVITDEGQTLAESGAIIDYLVERYGDGKLAPPLGTPERLRYDYWLHYSEGSAMPLLVMKLLLDNAWQTRVTRMDMDLILHVYAKRSKRLVQIFTYRMKIRRLWNGGDTEG